jgi:sulfatase modifying factor 1
MRWIFMLLLLVGIKSTEVTRVGKDFALLFAVENYSEWNKLSYPIDDAEAIAKDLEELYGFQVEIVRDPDKKILQDKLREYGARSYPADGQLLVFFSGHGTFFEGTKEGFVIPKDGKRNDPYQESYLTHDRLKKAVDAIPCNHILLAIDACFSGTLDDRIAQRGNQPDFTRPDMPGGSGGHILNNFIAEQLKYRSRFYITSGGKEQTPDRSQFARQILEALRSTTSEKRVLTFSGLCAFLERAVPLPRAGEFGGTDPGIKNFLFVRMDYNTSPPQRQHAAAGGQDANAWNGAKNTNTLEGYRDYLRNFPQGEFRELAAARIRELEENERDAADWQKAKLMNTRESYEQYCKTWPSGAYRELAEAAIKRLMPPSPDNVMIIYGGTFQMGSNVWEINERPVHPVTVGGYYLGKYEVTVRQFKEFIESSGYKTDAEKDGLTMITNEAGGAEMKPGVNWRHDAQGNLRPESEYNHPVIHVSWNDATEFCKWLSKKTGKNYRLPTEAEWEYAAGNGAKHTTYSWGNGDPVGKQGGNIADKSFKLRFPGALVEEQYNDGYVFTSPVGSFNPNEFGLYDMSGNVGEWCLDWYAPDYYANSPSSNPRGPTTGTSRAFRGGNWIFSSENCRVTIRNDELPITPSFRCNSVGFRLLRTL